LITECNALCLKKNNIAVNLIGGIKFSMVKKTSTTYIKVS